MYQTKKITKILQNPNLSISQKRVALIKDTKNYYAYYPKIKRAVDLVTGKCKYRNGAKACALGRFMNDEAIQHLEEYCLLEKLINHVLKDPAAYRFNIEILPDYIQTLDGEFVPFLHDLQTFHDNEEHWCDRDISPMGQARYQQLIECYSKEKECS